ncbi:MAG: hypothetical protein DMF68_04025 [Acidobacteria bacterium]|nr:MAG: hypothetical protein DMF68_04025 [Acidobacteriota bacterium]
MNELQFRVRRESEKSMADFMLDRRPKPGEGIESGLGQDIPTESECQDFFDCDICFFVQETDTRTLRS